MSAATNLSLIAGWRDSAGNVTPAQERSGDLILKDANIYAVDEHNPQVQAVAVKGDQTSSPALIQTPRPAPPRASLDLKGATVLPGLTDSHYHFLGVGARELSFNLEGTNSLGDLQAKAKERIVAAKTGERIVGRGWIETVCNSPAFHTAPISKRSFPTTL